MNTLKKTIIALAIIALAILIYTVRHQQIVETTSMATGATSTVNFKLGEAQKEALLSMPVGTSTGAVSLEFVEKVAATAIEAEQVSLEGCVPSQAITRVKSGKYLSFVNNGTSTALLSFSDKTISNLSAGETLKMGPFDAGSRPLSRKVITYYCNGHMSGLVYVSQ